MAAAQNFRDRTRATKYQQQHPLPPDFSQLLKDYTREVLREQPGNVLEWSAAYFKRMALESDPLQVRQPPPEHYAPTVENPELEVVAQRVTKVFAAMDDGDSGVLYVHLVKRALLEALQMNKEQALYILSSEYVAVNNDGTMEYRRFARDCVNAVIFFQQSNYEFADSQQLESVHGMLREELQDELLRVMRQADTEGLGRLTYVQYREALVNAPLQLTHRDINVLCAEAEQTSGGYIDFRIEVSHAFDLLCLSQAFSRFDEQHT